ncbi:MAG: hypothetical protein RMK84_12540 [Oscillochloridaceae bacterium]|nr:hypothetical protein [Chloroflexaceae bacterium]MDW8390947.1 hypothetical protein [Oscillochloridaceae bacterium]
MISIIAAMIGVGMIGGALMGWIVALVLVVNELVAPPLQEVLQRRRGQTFPAPSQTRPGF